MTYIPVINNGQVISTTFPGRPTPPSAPPTSYVFSGVINVGDFIYIFGGREYSNPSGSYQTNTPVTNAYKYSLVTDSFTAIASLPEALEAVNVQDVGNFIYILGGTTFRKYDIALNQYSSIASPPQAIDTSSTAIGQYIYVKGSGTSNLYRYDTVANSWSLVSSVIPTTASLHLVATDASTIYMLGVSASYVYSVTNNTYQTKVGFTAYYFSPSVKPVYLDETNSVSSNRQKIFFLSRTETGDSLPYIQTNVVSYNITSNSFSTLKTKSGSVDGVSACGVKTTGHLYTFNYTAWNFNTSSSGSAQIPYAVTGRYIPTEAAHTAAGNGAVFTYGSSLTILNSTSGRSGVTVTFKPGDVINNENYVGNVWQNFVTTGTTDPVDVIIIEN